MQMLALSELILAENMLNSRGANGVGMRVMSWDGHTVQLWWADFLGLLVSSPLSAMGWVVEEDYILMCTRAPHPHGVTSRLDVAEIGAWQ